MPNESNINPHFDLSKIDTKRLFDYTKFHVGLYSGLVFGVSVMIGIKGPTTNSPAVILLAALAVLSWVLSGFSGGVILGTLVEFNGTLSDFKKETIGPSRLPRMKGESWENMEHWSFWFGVLCAVSAILTIAVRLFCSAK